MTQSLKLLAIALVALVAVSIQPAHAGGSDVVGHGTFVGENKHVTTGGVSILKTASGHLVVLEKDFDLDGAPAPTIRFGKDGKTFSAEFSKLKNIKGLQVYAVPADINPADFNQFYIWCSKFDVSLGVAKLN